MNVKKILTWILIASAFALMSCSDGSSDTGSGTLRIVSVTPGPYTDNADVGFTVVVSYTLADTDMAELSIGFGYRDGSSTRTYSSKTDYLLPTDTEITKTYTFTKTMHDYSAEEGFVENVFKVILKPYPVEGTYTPYDSKTLTITINPPEA